MTESELLKKLDINKEQLDRLRRENNFPYTKLAKSRFVYTEKAVTEWIESRQIVLKKKKYKKKSQKLKIDNTEKIQIPKYWNRLSKKVAMRDGYRCQRCGSRNRLSVHHIKPRKHGGSNELRNLITLCQGCHNYVELNEIESWEELKRVKC